MLYHLTICLCPLNFLSSCKSWLNRVTHLCSSCYSILKFKLLQCTAWQLHALIVYLIVQFFLHWSLTARRLIWNTTSILLHVSIVVVSPSARLSTVISVNCQRRYEREKKICALLYTFRHRIKKPYGRKNNEKLTQATVWDGVCKATLARAWREHAFNYFVRRTHILFCGLTEARWRISRILIWIIDYFPSHFFLQMVCLGVTKLWNSNF